VEGFKHGRVLREGLANTADHEALCGEIDLRTIVARALALLAKTLPN
jgi:hypothetical protein